MASNNKKIRAHFCCCSAGSIATARKAQGASKKKKKKASKNKIAGARRSIGRVGRFSQRWVARGGGFVISTQSSLPPPVPLPTQYPTYATIVTATLAQYTAVASKKENGILLKNNASITRAPSGRASLTLLPRNARDFRPVFCPYFCYWPAAVRHPGLQPLSPPSNLHSSPVQLVPRRTLRGGSAGGGLVRLFLPRRPRLLWFSLYSLHTKTVCPVA